MTRFTRLFTILAVFCIALSLFVMSAAQASQTVVSTPSDMELTITSIMSAATQVQSLELTLAAPATETRQALQATRTAIAVTREPYLLTPQTPTDIELTATFILAERTQMFIVTPGNGTPAPIYLTATAIIDQSTAVAFQKTQTAFAITQNPVLAQTSFPTLTPRNCRLGVGSFFPEDVSQDFQKILNQSGIQFADAGVMVIGVHGGCEAGYDPLQTVVVIHLSVSDLSDEFLTGLMERILASLQNFAISETYKNIRLQVAFIDFYRLRFIDTGYANAISAYAEGLRGDELITAIGYILDS